MSGWLMIHSATSLPSTSNGCDLSGQCDLGGMLRMMASDFDFGFILWVLVVPEPEDSYSYNLKDYRSFRSPESWKSY